DGEAGLLELLPVSVGRWKIPRTEPVSVDSAARQDGAQSDNDRGGVVMAAHLGDKTASPLQRSVYAREHPLLIAHPVERRLPKNRVEFAFEGELLAIHERGVEAPRLHRRH